MAAKRGNNKKNPKTTASPPSPGRTPRTLVDPGSTSEDDYPRISFRYADRNFPVDWHEDGHPASVLAFLHDFSRSTWQELRGQRTGSGNRRGRYHSQEFHEVSAAAQERIQASRLDEVFNELTRYRTAGTARVWGFEREKVFYLLWWDPHHVVYELKKR